MDQALQQMLIPTSMVSRWERVVGGCNSCMQDFSFNLLGKRFLFISKINLVSQIFTFTFSFRIMIVLQKISKYNRVFPYILQTVFINTYIFQCNSVFVKTKKLTLAQVPSHELQTCLYSRQVDWHEQRIHIGQMQRVSWSGSPG